MRILTKLTWYKLKMLFSDRVFLTAMIVLPILIMLATGYALRYEKLNVIPVSIVDEDHSAYSKRLYQRFTEREGFLVYPQTREKAMEFIQGNKVEAVFIIQNGFEEQLKNGETKELIEFYKAPSSVSTGFIAEVFAGEVMRFITNEYALQTLRKAFGKNGRIFKERQEKEVEGYLDSLWHPKPLLNVSYQEMVGKQVTSVKGPSLPAATATSSGIIVVFLMFYILFNSGWLLEERVNGTLKRIVSVHKAMRYVYLSNIVALFLSGAAQIFVFTLVIRIAFGIVLFTNPLAYAVFGIYLLATIGISLLLSAICKTPAQIQATAPFLALMTSFIGGCFWNFVKMPENIRILSLFTPQGWALQGINSVLLNQFTFLQFFLPLIVLFFASAILIPLAYWKIQRRMQ